MMRESAAAVALLGLMLAACGGEQQAGGATTGENLSGTVQADGSSTVFPITEAVAEDFGGETKGNVRVTVGTSGTGGGFKRFCAGETDISNASRPIKDSERQQCQAAGVEPVEIPVAYDGLAVVVHPDNTWVDCLTVAELKKIWEPNSRVARWSDVRAGWPSQQLRLFGPGTDSGTFDYFTETINGKEDASRPDYTASEDDNILVQGVSGERNSLGYFGLAYVQENRAKLKLVPVDGGGGCVTPSEETVKGGQYKPLSRPLFIYVSGKSLQRPEVKAFVQFYLEHAPSLAPEVGYVPLEDAQYQQQLQRLQQGASGAS